MSIMLEPILGHPNSRELSYQSCNKKYNLSTVSPLDQKFKIDTQMKHLAAQGFELSTKGSIGRGHIASLFKYFILYYKRIYMCRLQMVVYSTYYNHEPILSRQLRFYAEKSDLICSLYSPIVSASCS